ncbi:MAG: extracellular solute-binding protein [Deltaproteobacteria bacterium]|nr:extracellular solute-binding protein [Deltaproteobacteria bacterium]
MNHSPRLLLVFLVFIISVGSSGDVSSQTAGSQAAVIEAAKREGTVIFYGALNINDSRLLLKRFEEKYPFIKTENLRMSAEPLLNRILTEDKAGRNSVDLINNTVLNALKKAGLLQPYRSPENSAYPEQFRDPDGYWTSLYNNYYVLGYNSNLVSAREAPRDWPDLLNPKWKGKIGMDQEEYEWYAATLQYWGREKAQKFHRALARQDIHWRKGHTLISQLIVAGEFPVGIVYAHRAESMKKAGAPIGWVKSSDPVFVTLSPITIAAKAPHPNAAKLLFDFMLSKEAQLMLRGVNRISGRLDVEPLVPEMHPSKLKLVAIDPRVAEELGKYSREFQDIYFR